jgi:RimJ/RimL family protein N-acetyltransferase
VTAPSGVSLDVVESADIRGRKTRIRPMRANEAPMVFAWIHDPDVAPFWGGHDHNHSLDEFLADWEPYYLDGSEPQRGRSFIIEADERPVGMINYNRVDLSSGSTEIDIVIGAAGYRDAGYGTDALRAFLRFLFDDVGLHRVWLTTYEYNARARRAYEKVGMTREGLLREDDLVDGRWVNAVLYGILSHELDRGPADA